MVRTKPVPLGMIAPMRKAPNSAWMPITSVIQAAAKANTSVPAMIVRP